MKKLIALLATSASMFAAVTSWGTPTIVNGSVSGDPTGFGINIDADGNGAVLFGTDTPSLNASAGTLITGIDTGAPVNFPVGLGVGRTGSFMALWIDTSENLQARPFTYAGTLGTRTLLASNVSANPNFIPELKATPAGNMYAVYVPTTENVILSRYYTASTETWGSQFAIVGDDINALSTTVNAGNILLVTWINAGTDLRALFFDGSTQQGTEKGITGNIDTNSKPAVAAQIKSTDSGGLFMAAYKHTDGGAYVNIHSETLNDAWQGEEKLSGISEVVVDDQVGCSMSPSGNAIVAWRTTDNTLRAAIYLASLNTFSNTVTLVSGIDNIGGIESGSDGTFTITYDTTENSAKVHKSITITPPTTIASPINIWTATSVNVSRPVLAINPRGTIGISAWSSDGTSIYKALSQGTSNHGAGGSNAFRKGSSALRPGRKPFR